MYIYYLKPPLQNKKKKISKKKCFCLFFPVFLRIFKLNLKNYFKINSQNLKNESEYPMIPIFSCDTTDHHTHLPRHLAPDKIPHFIAGNFKNSLYPCKGKSKFQIQTLSIYILWTPHFRLLECVSHSNDELDFISKN